MVLTFCRKCGGEAPRAKKGLCKKCRSKIRHFVGNSSDCKDKVIINHPNSAIHCCDPVIAGAVFQRIMEKREYDHAQHGPVRVLFEAGKPVDKTINI